MKESSGPAAQVLRWIHIISSGPAALKPSIIESDRFWLPSVDLSREMTSSRLAGSFIDLSFVKTGQLHSEALQRCEEIVHKLGDENRAVELTDQRYILSEGLCHLQQRDIWALKPLAVEIMEPCKYGLFTGVFNGSIVI